MPLALAAPALEQIPAGFEGNHPKALTTVMPLGCKERFIRATIASMFLLGKFRGLGCDMTTGNGCAAIQVSDSSWNFLACLPYIKFHLLDRCSPQAYYSLPDKCRQRLLIRHLSRFQQDFKATILRSFDNGNAPVCECSSGRRSPYIPCLASSRRLSCGITTRSEELRKCILCYWFPFLNPAINICQNV